VLPQTTNTVARSADDPLPTVTATSRGIGLVEPFTVQFKGTAADQLPHTARSVAVPLGTLCGSGADFGVCEPFLVPANYGERPGQAPRTHGLADPVPTIVGTAAHALIEPFLLGQQSGATPRPVGEPAPTVAASGAISLIEPYLVSYYGTGGPRPVGEPLDTVTTRDRFGLVEGVGLDILFRMLQPHELSAAMGFPGGYKFAGNKSEVVRQIGNAVSVRTARALCAAALRAIGRAA
jgi:DNA (cytosine-5)-methyltransferase 1